MYFQDLLAYENNLDEEKVVMVYMVEPKLKVPTENKTSEVTKVLKNNKHLALI